MKTFFKVLLCAIFIQLTACSDKTAQKNIAMYTQAWDDIINNGNLEAINGDNFDTNITLISSPENIVGIEDFKSYYSNFTTGFSDREFTIEDIFGDGNKLVKHWNFKGTNTGEFFGMPPTGKQINVSGVTLVKMKDGKILQEQDFMDNLEFMGQLGIDPFLNPTNVSLIRKLYDDFATGNIEAVGAAMDDKIVWNEAENFPLADGNPYIGFDAILQGVFARIGSEWDYWKLNDVALHEMTNNKILATGRYEAKYKKNGVEIDLQMAHLWTLKDGKIIAFQQYADTKGITDAMAK